MTDNMTKTPGKNDPDTEPGTATGAEFRDEAVSVPNEEADALKRRLYLQIGLAVALILVLLGGLALVDEMNAPPPKPVEPVARAASPAQALPAAPPAPQVPALSAESAEAAALPEATADAAQESSAPPTSPETLTAEPAAAPPLRPLTQPASARLAAIPPGESGRALKPAPTARGEPAAELARQAQIPPSAHTQAQAQAPAPASRPLSRASAHTIASGGGYLLQLGVFSNTANAEELRATLELNGIPAQVESRVQVGPFASRAEAEQMRERLKKLGMNDGVLVTSRK